MSDKPHLTAITLAEAQCMMRTLDHPQLWLVGAETWAVETEHLRIWRIRNEA